MKSIYLLTVLPGILLLGGCKEADVEVCRYYVQQDLDSANYKSAITRLDDPDCQATYPGEEFYVDLGTAYLGKAGLSLPDVMGAMIDDNDNAGDEQFATFVKEITDSTTDSALLDITNSRRAFSEYLGKECKDILDPNSTQDGVCLLTGFVDILKTTMAIDAMTDGGVDEWTEGDSPAMSRSTCALQYSVAHKDDSDISLPYSTKCESGTSVDNSEAVTFTAEDNSTKQYNSLTVSYAGDPGYFLESEALGSTIFTKGYCQTDYSVCDDPSVQGCYSCPVSEGEDDLNIQDFVLDALNNGFDNIETLIANSDEEDSDELQESIDDFKKEIKPDGCEQTPEGKDCFTMDDIVKYLNK